MINNVLILYPVAALAALTFAVLLLVPIFRFVASFRGQSSARDYRMGESERVPEWVRLANRNYMNLLESPVLFYVICLVIYVTASLTELELRLAWAYVGFRLAHSAVHITINRILIRLPLFACSVVCLVGLWGLVFVPRLLGH
jgi:hypothetical protein